MFRHNNQDKDDHTKVLIHTTLHRVSDHKFQNRVCHILSVYIPVYTALYMVYTVLHKVRGMCDGSI